MAAPTVSLIIAVTLLAACGGSLGDCGPTDGGPTDVPLSLVPIVEPTAGGATTSLGVRFALEFQIGKSGPISAFLDTGSYGIQLVQDAVSPAVIAAIGDIGTTQLTETFESGIEATGVIARAAVTFGDLTTPLPIQIFLIQKLSCAAGFPCEGASAPLAELIFNGYSAIVGVGLRGAALAPGLGSPIPQLPGHPAFIIKAPAFGGDAGVLRIGPSVEEVSAYQTVQLVGETGAGEIAACAPVWNDSSVPACVIDETTSAQYCGDSVLDTGAPITLVEWLRYSGPEVLPASSKIQVEVGPKSAPIGQFEVVVSSDPQPGQDFFDFIPSTLGANLINLGTTVFYRYDVYFNQAKGQIGLLPH